MSTGKTKEELLNMAENCSSIAELFQFVRAEEIDIRMRTLCSASCIPPEPKDEEPSEPPLERLKNAVRSIIESSK